MGLFGNAPAQRLQLFHHDNGDLEFIRRKIIGESATELDNTGNPKRSWIDYFQTLYPFDGYKGVPADGVQIAYGRHFHLELHNILKKEQRPPDDNSLDSPFISAIAESRAIEITKSAKPRTIYEKLTLILAGALTLQLIVWGIAYVVK